MKKLILISFLLTITAVSVRAQVGVVRPILQNVGQLANEKIIYYSDMGDNSAYLSRDGALAYRFAGISFNETMIDAIFPAKVNGTRPTGAAINYFRSLNGELKRYNVPGYNEITLERIKKGVDLSLRASAAGIEKVLTLYPGGNVPDISFRIDFDGTIALDKSGGMEFSSNGATLRLSRPIAYQIVNDKRISIPVSYRLRGRTYGFDVGRYDHSRPLIIDPTVYSTLVGVSERNQIQGIKAGADGNVYVVGVTNSSEFPITKGTFSGKLKGNLDLFVSKFDPTLTKLIASTYIGGSGDDYGQSIDLDKDGNIYVAGYTSSGDFPTTPRAYSSRHNGGFDLFVTKLTNDLSMVLASTLVGGTGDEYSSSMIVSLKGLYIAGHTTSGDFPVSKDGYSQKYKGRGDGFILRLDNELSTLGASTYIGGNDSDIIKAMAITDDNEVYVVGQTSSYDFPTLLGAYSRVLNGSSNLFVCRFNTDLRILVFSTLLGGRNKEYAASIILPDKDSVIVSGTTFSKDFITTKDTYSRIIHGISDIFVTRLKYDLTDVLASTLVGGMSNNLATGSVLSREGDIYITGTTDSSDFPVTEKTIGGGSTDSFLIGLSPDLKKLNISMLIGGKFQDMAGAISIGRTGAIYIAGTTNSKDFKVSTGASDKTISAIDGFIVGFDIKGRPAMDLSKLPKATIVVSDSSPPRDDLAIIFKGVKQGDTKSGNITITNVGSTELHIGYIAQKKSILPPFRLIKDECSGRVLKRLERCEITAAYSPTEEKAYNSVFDIPANIHNGQILFTLKNTEGKGGKTGEKTPVERQEALLSKDSKLLKITNTSTKREDGKIIFGIKMANESAQHTVTVTNTGSKEFVVGKISQLKKPFGLSEDTCSGATVAPSKECTFSIMFQPEGGGVYSDEYTLPITAPVRSSYRATVSGIAKGPIGH